MIQSEYKCAPPSGLYFFPIITPDIMSGQNIGTVLLINWKKGNRWLYPIRNIKYIIKLNDMRILRNFKMLKNIFSSDITLGLIMPISVAYYKLSNDIYYQFSTTKNHTKAIPTINKTSLKNYKHMLDDWNKLQGIFTYHDARIRCKT